jgi:hypothetical protein
MPTVQFHFLGPLDIRRDGQPLPQPATLKSQSLLVYLVLHRDRPQPRERLAATAGQDAQRCAGTGRAGGYGTPPYGGGAAARVHVRAVSLGAESRDARGTAERSTVPACTTEQSYRRRGEKSEGVP